MLLFTDYQDLFLSCRLCFTKLKLLLLAIEVQNESGDGKKIAVNPKETKYSGPKFTHTHMVQKIYTGERAQ